MLDREFQEWFRPRPGRCATCARHLMTIDENEDMGCCCEVEERETAGWTPGMHLDHCAFPAFAGEQGCVVWAQAQPLEEEG